MSHGFEYTVEDFQKLILPEACESAGWEMEDARALPAKEVQEAYDCWRQHGEGWALDEYLATRLPEATEVYALESLERTYGDDHPDMFR